MQSTIYTCVLCRQPIRTGAFVRCTMCGLVQKSPMLTAAQIASLYREDMDHFEPYEAQLAVHKAYFKRVLQGVQGKSLLDIGCALGALLEVAQEQGMRAYGVDISKDAVAYCRKRGFKVSQTWPAKTFDVVTAFQVLEHERDPMGFIKRIHKVLNKGGMVILATPNYGGVWRKIMGKHWFGFSHPEHVVLLDHQSMTYLLEHAGFRDIQIAKDQGRPFPLSFAFKRAADYFPVFARLLKPLGALCEHLDIKNPINPWDDMIIYARK